MQLQLYQDECTRLRLLLEEELIQGKRTVAAMAKNHINVLSINSEEDRRRIAEQFAQMESELAEATEARDKLRHELDKERKNNRSANKSVVKGNDLVTRQAKLIQHKMGQIKSLTDQLQAAHQKYANYDRVLQRNMDLTKQVQELKQKFHTSTQGSFFEKSMRSTDDLGHSMRRSQSNFTRKK